MARSIETIRDEIVAAVQADATLGPLLTSASAVAIWRRWCWAVAVAIWAVEVLFDNFKAEVQEIVDAQKPHSLRWYRQKALDYQHGGTLAEGEDTYDNTGLTDDQVAAQKIVRQAAATETGGLVTVKVAKETAGGALTELETGEMSAFTSFINEIKDAGVFVQTLSTAGDDLRLVLDVYFDPTVLAYTGARLDGTSDTPVEDAIRAFLRTLPFDGLFIPARLVDAVQAVEGVRTLVLRVCEAKRNDDATYSGVAVWYSPYAGYLKLPSGNLTINYEIE